MPFREISPSPIWSVPAQASVETWYAGCCATFKRLGKLCVWAAAPGRPGGKRVIPLREGKRGGNMQVWQDSSEYNLA